LRVSNRNRNDTSNRNNNLGFRLAQADHRPRVGSPESALFTDALSVARLSMQSVLQTCLGWQVE
jgi:hypothetical protein